ncbi:MAG: GMC family oxidoreductase N-terminal domain-containing protein [Myxococcales bacterium]|nr:GMC family oxidoreductase N-terminal domain-containing protein [Myxococcales bacterium]
MTVLAHEDYAEDQSFEADVVVVGTGAGGAAAGAALAEAGHHVMFVEEGSYHPTSSFNPYTTQSVPRLYRDASATMIVGRTPIPYVEGRCVGGSTVINGGMAYRPPERVLADWERITRSSDMGVTGLDEVFQEVEHTISANYQSEVSVGEDSRLMEAGAKKMGWHYTTNRRNQSACVGANNCALGCPTGAKQSTLVSYLPRAFARGADCLTEVRVEQLWIEGGRCVGIIGRSINPQTRKADRKVRVRARAVIVACGAVQTPLLLQKHKLGRRSGQLGKNFLCHPNAKVLAVYPHQVDGYKGVSQNTQIREFHEDGLLFAENFVAPGILAAYLPFHGSRAWELMSRYENMVISGVLVEDSTSGSVSRTMLGMPLVRYDLTNLDHQRFKRGVKLLASMHFELGAEMVVLPFTNQHIAYTRDDLDKIDELQTDVNTLELFTVHLMGTARMGSDPATSVVNLSGEVWDLPGCYVADASLFPTAIGVNPQVTIMALATRIGRRLELSARAA